MYVPRFWARAEGSGIGPEGQTFRLQPWGWSDESAAHALARARDRLVEIKHRLAQGEDLKGPYLYGATPIREEIIGSVGGKADEALVTRNRYGALVLNTARVPFVDIDTPAPRVSWVKRVMGAIRREAPDETDPALVRIRAQCAQYPANTFRVYRTRAGYRILASDLLLDPSSDEARDFLSSFGSDPSFIKLCRVQASFRARLTPKPWRCGCELPRDRYPFEDSAASARMAAWLQAYETASWRYATCQYIETIGRGRESREAAPIREEHDRSTRAESGLPLA